MASLTSVDRIVSEQLTKLVPSLSRKEDCRKVYSMQTGANLSAFWTNAIEQYVAIKNNEGTLSFKIGELIMAFTVIHGVYPESLVAHIRNNFGNGSLWSRQQIKLAPSLSSTSSTSSYFSSSSASFGGSIVSSILSGAISTGSWLVSTSWSLIAGSGGDDDLPSALQVDNCDDLKDDFFLPSVLDKLSDCVVEYANSKNSYIFANANPGGSYSFRDFLKEVTTLCTFSDLSSYEAGGVLKHSSANDVNLLIDYMCFRKTCLTSGDGKYLKIRASVGVEIDKKVFELDITKLNLRLQINDIDLKMTEKDQRILECNVRALELNRKGDKKSALFDMKRRQHLEKQKDTYSSLKAQLENMLDALETAEMNKSFLESMDLVTSNLKRINSEIPDAEETMMNYEEQKENLDEVGHLVQEFNNIEINDDELEKALQELMIFDPKSISTDNITSHTAAGTTTSLPIFPNAPRNVSQGEGTGISSTTPVTESMKHRSSHSEISMLPL